MKTPKKIALTKLSIKLFLIGLTLFMACAIVLVSLILRWKTFHLYDVLIAYFGICFLGLSIALMVLPLQETVAGKKIIYFALYPARWLLKMKRFYNSIAIPYFTVLIIIVISAIVFQSIQSLINIPPKIQLSIWYTALTIDCLVLTYASRGLAEFLIRVFRASEDYSKIYDALKPSSMRFILYFCMAGMYLIVDFVYFSKSGYLSNGLIGFRKLLVEVLLTYVAIDSALKAWRERGDIRPTKE